MKTFGFRHNFKNLNKTIEHKGSNIKYKMSNNDILTYLDIELQNFYIKNNKYPNKILVNKEIYDKIFKELDNDINNYDNSWVDKRDNYKGILLEIRKEVEFIKLED